MILPAQIIRKMCKTEKPMVFPFSEKTKVDGYTYGLSEAGYDVRIRQDLTLYPRTLKYLIMNANGFKRPHVSLASTMESVSIPDDIMVMVLDKSTWARRFVLTQNTVIEPGHIGGITLELSNDSNTVVKIKAGTPISQFVFHRLEEPTESPYRGKYQYQMMEPQEAIYDR